MKAYKKISVIFIFNCLSVLSFANQKASVESDCTKIINLWLNESLNLTKNCVGFSPPVAARTFNYLQIANYEAVIEFLSDYTSLSGQLNSFERKTWKTADENLNYPLVLNELNFALIAYFYANMPPENIAIVKNLYLKTNKQFKLKTHNKHNIYSIKYAQNLAFEIIEWSKKDGGDEAYKKNFPSDYKGPSCNSCWVKTTPGYIPALLPYWGNNSLMIKSNGSVCNNIPVLTYSEAPNSHFFKEADTLYQLYQRLEPRHELIAEYWDDSPGYSGTPVGHLFNIALELSQKENFSLAETVHFYTTLGITINDVVIEAWRLKYSYNLLRPITFIHKNISTEFNTLLNTPPFPEFPSAHSFQAGAALEVFMLFFGDDYSFEDTTNANRNDIDGTPRTFSSFTQMTNEMSLSRFYGGIHYLNTLEVSLDYGKKIGANTISNLNFKK